MLLIRTSSLQCGIRGQEEWNFSITLLLLATAHVWEMHPLLLHPNDRKTRAPSPWQYPPLAYPDGDAASWFIQRTLMVIHRLALLLLCSCCPADPTDDKVYIHSAGSPPSAPGLAPLLPLLLAQSQSASMRPLSLSLSAPPAAHSSAYLLLSHCSVPLNTRLPALSPPRWISLLSSSLSVCLRPSSPGLHGRLTCVLVPLWRWLVPQGRRGKDGLGGLCTQEEEEEFLK